MRLVRLPAALILALSQGPALGAAELYTAPENLKAREWFQEARFGLFVHWGVYSVLGDGEWVMDNQNPVLALPRVRLPLTVKSASFLGGGPPVPVTTTQEAILLRVGSRREPPDTVVVLETTTP